MLVFSLDRGISNVLAVTRVQCSVFTTSQKSQKILCENLLRIRWFLSLIVGI